LAEDLQRAKQFVRQFNGCACSQRDLADALSALDDANRRVDACAFFLSSGYYAVQGSFRSEDGFTVAAVLDDDLAEIERRIELRQPIDGYVLPAPRRAIRADKRSGRLPPYLHVVSASDYDCERGLVTAPEEGGLEAQRETSI
jgi:CRISPR-associated endonuclease/helicase Cas3